MTHIILGTIDLPADLQWADEFTAWRVGQQARTSLTGALIVQESARQAGRPITLKTTRDGTAYVGVVSLPTLRALQESESEARAAPIDLIMPAHNGGDRAFQVRWRRTDGPAIEVEPTRFAVPALDADLFSITLRLMTV